MWGRSLRLVTRSLRKTTSASQRRTILTNAANAFSTKSIRLFATNTATATTPLKCANSGLSVVTEKTGYRHYSSESSALKQNDSLPWSLKLGGKIYTNPQKFENNPNATAEDAFFITDDNADGNGTDNSSSSITAFGVADGVGDWVHSRGVDSAQYAKALVSQSKALFQAHPEMVPTDVVNECYEEVTRRGVQGSSTLCLASFDRLTGKLRIANLVRNLHGTSLLLLLLFV